MKVTKFLKGLLAVTLAVTMAVTPVTTSKAAEVTVTSGASTYTFSEMPVAAFQVTGFWDRPFILYCLPVGTQIHSQAGSSEWESYIFATESIPESFVFTKFGTEVYAKTETERNGTIYTPVGYAFRMNDGTPYLSFVEIYHTAATGCNQTKKNHPVRRCMCYNAHIRYLCTNPSGTKFPCKHSYERMIL